MSNQYWPLTLLSGKSTQINSTGTLCSFIKNVYLLLNNTIYIIIRQRVCMYGYIFHYKIHVYIYNVRCLCLILRSDSMINEQWSIRFQVLFKPKDLKQKFLNSSITTNLLALKLIKYVRLIRNVFLMVKNKMKMKFRYLFFQILKNRLTQRKRFYD